MTNAPPQHTQCKSAGVPETPTPYEREPSPPLSTSKIPFQLPAVQNLTHPSMFVQTSGIAHSNIYRKDDLPMCKSESAHKLNHYS